MYEIYCKLRDSRGLKDARIAEATGIGKSTFSDWKSGRSVPKHDKLQKIADYFGVTVDYLLNGNEEPQQKESTLTPKDERDIAKDLDALMDKIATGEDSPLYYNGETVDKESMELLRDAIGMSLRHLKIINKEKYNPRKNKKAGD